MHGNIVFGADSSRGIVGARRYTVDAREVVQEKSGGKGEITERHLHFESYKIGREEILCCCEFFKVDERRSSKHLYSPGLLAALL